MPAPPILFSEDLETRAGDEDETIRALNATFDTILETVAKDGGHAMRGVHAKAHGLLAATLTVHDGLPPELAQGLFTCPGTHQAWMRFSTNPGDVLDDAISLPRGLAIKVLDVPGERLPGAEGTTQDFVMVNGPVFVAPTAKKFLGNLRLLAKTTDRMEGVKKVASSALRGVNAALQAVGIESPSLQSLGGAPNLDPLGETFYSATAFRFGDHVAKFSVAPVAAAQRARAGAVIDTAGRPDAIRETMRSAMAGLDAEWAFRVQLCRDPVRQPVEDPTVAWSEEDAPFQTVATLVAPRQDSWSDAHVRAVDEEMRFSVWTGLTAHRPLGNVNRARRDVYRHSAAFRARFNGCPLHEPAGA